jgi:hypothetical protein
MVTWVATGLGPDFEAHPLYLQQLTILIEAPEKRMGDHEDLLSTVGFHAYGG